MNLFLETAVRALLIGIGATIFFDLWQVLLKALKVPTLNFAYLGRWVGHGLRGQWTHAAIAKAAPVPGELALGWVAHYAIGVVFAALLLGVFGLAWAHAPSVLPALGFGVLTAAAPLFVMQPAMGAGFASAKTPTPIRNCLKSVINHAVFGLSLYAAALLTAAWL